MGEDRDMGRMCEETINVSLASDDVRMKAVSSIKQEASIMMGDIEIRHDLVRRGIGCGNYK